MTLRTLFMNLTDLLLPHTCVLCNQISDCRRDLCAKCFAKLPVYPAACLYCGNRLAIQTDLPCGACQQTPPPFDTAFALFAWRPPVSRMLTQLKFYHALIHARLFAELLAEKILHDWYCGKPLPDAIVPVPLHPARTRQRGYNQTLEIAKSLAQKLSLPVLNHVCQRTRPTLPQTSLPAKERRNNVRHAFQISNPVAGITPGMTLAILDDVITTGSTMRALSEMLKKKLACRIDVWCCARV
jgi:ComF family protein